MYRIDVQAIAKQFAAIALAELEPRVEQALINEAPRLAKHLQLTRTPNSLRIQYPRWVWKIHQGYVRKDGTRKLPNQFIYRALRRI